MSTLDFDFDLQLNHLESEWRQVYDASIVARADYQILAANPATRARVLDVARERLEHAEALRSRIMTKIERLEDAILGQN